MSKKTYYEPEIRFTTLNGETTNAKLNKTSGSSAYSAGDKVKIIYSKDDTNEIIVDSFFSKYGFQVIFIAAGALVLLIGLLQVIRR